MHGHLYELAGEDDNSKLQAATTGKKPIKAGSVVRTAEDVERMDEEERGNIKWSTDEKRGSCWV